MDDLRETLRENLIYLRDQEHKIQARLTVLPRGRIREKRIGSGVYHYLLYRKGRFVKTDYLGKSVTPVLRAELDERIRLEEELARVRSGLKMMKSGGPKEADISESLREILRILTEEKMWDLGVEIIGSWCFLLYQRTLPIEKYPFRTDDLDILIPRPFKGKDFDLGGSLTRLGFSRQFHPDGSQYFAGLGMKIEFLTKEGRKMRALRSSEESSIVPQRLRYLDILFVDPIMLKVAPGIRVKVPAPAAFLLHKLIIATLPGRTRKKDKDIRQAIYTASYVFSESGETARLGEMYKSLPKGWKSRIGRALRAATDLMPLEEGIIRRLKEVLQES